MFKKPLGFLKGNQANKVMKAEDKVINPEDKVINPEDNVINPEDYVINPEDYLNKHRPDEDKNSLFVKPFSEGKKGKYFYVKPSIELNLLSHHFDVRFRIIENLNLLFVTIATAGAITAATGFTVATAGVGAAPILLFVAFLPTIGRCAQLFPSQWYKTSELQYICSACLSMVTNMQDDLIKLKKFYRIVENIRTDKDDEIKNILNGSYHSFNEYEQPNGLYIPVEKNLYKFLFLLLNAIDFNTPNGKMTELQETFFIGLFNYCDFEKPRYTIIFEEGVAKSSELTTEEKDSRRNGKFMFRYTHLFCKFNSNPNNLNDNEGFKESNISNSLYNTNNQARICNNYNDVIVRMLHEKFFNAKNVFDIILAKEKSRVKFSAENEIALNLELEINKTIANNDNNNNNLDNQKNNNNNIEQTYPLIFKISKFLNKYSSKQNFNPIKKRINTFVSGIIDSPTQKYREMLREYVIMTGNWSMIISKYSIQYNEFILLAGDKIYKTKLTDIDKETAKYEGEFDKNMQEIRTKDVVIDEINKPENAVPIDTVTVTNNSNINNGGRPRTKRLYKRKKQNNKTKNIPKTTKNRTKSRK
jgi:hypothetical protein